MIFDHVAEGANLFVVAAATLDADGLGHRELDVIDEVAVPDRLEDAIGQAEGQNVLHSLFAEVVVDAEDLRLLERVLHGAVEVPRRLEIHAERLFDHQADKSVLVRSLVQARGAQLAGDHFEQLRRRRQIEQSVALRAVAGVDLLQPLA